MVGQFPEPEGVIYKGKEWEAIPNVIRRASRDMYCRTSDWTKERHTYTLYEVPFGLIFVPKYEIFNLSS